MTELRLQALRELDDEALAAAYATPTETWGKPWLRVNFVSTVDGAAHGSDGLSTSINDAADKRVFDLLRAQADCLVVGAGTLRAEGYDVPRVPLVIVSREGQVPDNLRDAPPNRILMASVESSPYLTETRELLGPENTLVLGSEEIDFVELKSLLAQRGWANQLCEGGPQLFGTLAAAGVVDELCCTIVPRLAGGEALRIMVGPEVDVALELTSLLEQDGTLLGRWRVS